MSAPESVYDRLDSLRTTQNEILGELAETRREEEYLKLKLRQAAEQVRYYEGLLSLLRRDLGRAPGITDLLRRLP